MTKRKESISDKFCEAIVQSSKYKQAKKGLRELEDYYEALLQSLTEAIFIFKGGVITWCNDSVEEIYGYPKDELLGKRASFFFPKDICPTEFVKTISSSLREQGAFHGTARFQKKNGSFVYIEYSLSQVPGKDPNAIIAVARDITERKHSEEALKDSEERYRALVETAGKAGEGILITQNNKIHEGAIVFVNDEFARMLEYPKEDLLTKTIWDLVPEDFIPELQNRYRQRQKGMEVPSRYEITFIRKNGTIIPVELSVGIMTWQGRIATVAYVRDVTERKRAEEALRESEKKYRQLVENMQEGIWAIDENAHTTFVNPRMAEILGYPIDEMQQKHLLEFTDEQGAQAIKEYLAQLNLGMRGQRDFQFIRKDGARVYTSLEASPIFNEKGNYLGAVACVADITERKRVEKERERLLAELAEKTKELEQIVYVTSHDLRSPLVNIQGFTKELDHACKQIEEILNSKAVSSPVRKKLLSILNEDIAGALQYIVASSSKMDSLLSGLLRLSRLGRAVLNIKQLDMNKLMSDVISSFEFQIKGSGATVEVEDLPPCLGDETQVNQVFSNLMDNALKFLDPSRPGVIKVSGRAGKEEVVYCVQDNGIGIAENDKKAVFEIFRRLNPDVKTGEGLGLTIVRKILDRHGGKIWVESELGKGSEFFVSLPAKARAK